MPGTVVLGERSTTAADIAAVARGEKVEIGPAASARIEAARVVVENALRGDRLVYGLNTRLGAARDERLELQQIEAFQREVIDNHRGGTGAALTVVEVRATIAARIAVIANGGAGVRLAAVRSLAALLNVGVTPVVAVRGSVGAADLSHLAAIVAVASGRGDAELDGERMPASEALERAGLEPLVLAPHEALALLSGNAFSIGVGSLVAEQLESLARAADTAVALSLEALGGAGGGGLSPFSSAVQRAGGGAGQAASARAVRSLLEGSRLADAARTVSVQDPLSVRSAPQLHGALREQLAQLRVELDRELSARSENPVVWIEDESDVAGGEMISGGNFLALPLALSFEAQRLVLAHMASGSERRTAQLSELLRPFRSAGASVLPGLSWYAAASALAELRQLASPATLGAPTLSLVEDVATLAPTALTLLQRSIPLALEVLAVEALHAAELLRIETHRGEAPKLGAGTEPVVRLLVELVTSGADTATLSERAASILST